MTELTIIENINAVEVFKTGGVKPLIDQVREEVSSEVPDPTTKKGRDRIASLAHKVARSKTALDKAGKELADQLNAQLKPINAERKIARDELDKLKEEIRKPLTDWENSEKDRVDAHKSAISNMEVLSRACDDDGQPLHAYQLKSFLDDLEAIKLGDHWEEFEAEADRAKEKSISDLKKTIDQREKYEAEQAELDRLRKEKEEQVRIERERKIAEEAAEKARLEAEAKAKAESDRAAREKAESEERELQAKIAAEQSEQRRIEAEEQAKRDAKAAEQKRLADIEAAKQQEIARQQAEKQRQEEEQRQREADKEHRKVINNNIVQALMQTGITEAQAQQVVVMTAKGQVPHMNINY